MKKGLEIAWGHRKRGQPTGYGDIDSDDDTDMSLVAREQREQARELKQRRPCISEQEDSRFVLLKEGESLLGEYKGQEDLTCAYGVLGSDV